MEYLYYVLVVAILLGCCVLALRASHGSEPQARGPHVRKGARAQSGQASQPPLSPARQRAILERELRQVPTPWGWPGSELGHEANGSNGHAHSSLHDWVDWLIREKRTVEDDDYRVRRNASLRALLEDRYGRAVEPRSQRYEKVKPPQLRDPTRPYDQQDNFPSGKTEHIVKGLARQPGQPSSALLRRGRQPALREVKTPWGW